MLVEMNPSGGGGGGTEITPSNSSPVALTSGETYTTNGNGYAIQSYTSKTPSSSPSSVSSGDIVKMGGSGYLINSYSSVTPSSSGTYFSAGMKNMASSGYAYSSKPESATTGTFTTTSANETVSFNTQKSSITKLYIYGFQPDATRHLQFIVYWNNTMGDYYNAAGPYGGGSYYNKAFSSTSNTYAPSIVSINNGVVSLKNMSSTTSWGSEKIDWEWIAI